MQVQFITFTPMAVDTILIGFTLLKSGEEVWSTGPAARTITEDQVGIPVAYTGSDRPYDADELVVAVGDSQYDHMVGVFDYEATEPGAPPTVSFTVPAQPDLTTQEFGYPLDVGGGTPWYIPAGLISAIALIVAVIRGKK